MKRLFLLRHAKSSWAQPGTGDFDRPLNGRGQAALPLIANAMAARNYRPQKVYCSSANRTRLTLEGITQVFPDAETHFEDALYEAPTTEYLAIVRNSGPADSVLIVGHNPACDDFARMLCRGEGPAMARFVQKHFPTGALAVIDLDIENWADVEFGGGHLVDFLTPREL